MKNFLTEKERENLKIQHRKERDRRTGDRIKAILLSDDGWTFKQIAKALFLDEETISKHVNEYREKKKLSIQTGGSVSRLNDLQTKELIAHLKETTYLKVKDICACVRLKYDINYTTSGMTAWLKTNGFSFKKPKPTPAKADPVKQNYFVKYYENLNETIPNNDLILFLDGVHPTMATKVAYGWIRKGTDKLISTTASRTRVNILGTIDLKKLNLHSKSYQTINSNSMIDFWAFLREKYPTNKKIHVILDNGPYNKSKATRDAAAAHNIILHYLPPYSPNLNPIERVWKVMNEQVRNNVFFASAKEFKKTIADFFCTGWNNIKADMFSRINDNFQTFSKSMV